MTDASLFLLYELAGPGYCHTVCATPGSKPKVIHADPAINFAIGKPLGYLLKIFDDGKLKLLEVRNSK